MSFKSILVPFDKSQLSMKAIDKAIEFSKANPARIYILHVINEIPLPMHFSKIEAKSNDKVVISPLANQVYDELKSEMNPILKDIKKKYHEYEDDITIEILVGDPADKIIEFVKQNNIDLVILGSIGLRGFSGMIKRIGSVARSVAEEVSCPVLIMR